MENLIQLGSDFNLHAIKEQTRKDEEKRIIDQFKTELADFQTNVGYAYRHRLPYSNILSVPPQIPDIVATQLGTELCSRFPGCVEYRYYEGSPLGVTLTWLPLISSTNAKEVPRGFRIRFIA